MSPQRVVPPFLAVVLAGWGVGDAVLVGWSSPAPVSVLVALLAGLPIAALVRRPYAVAGVVTAVLVVHGLLWSQPEAPAETLALLVVAFGIGAYGAASYPLWVLLGLGAVVVQLRDLDDPGLGGVLFMLGSWAIALGVGRAVTQREHAEEADRVAAATTRGASAEVAAAALARERERIARDLHDVVTHSVALMVQEADLGREIVVSAPGTAEAALVAIEEIGQQALTDLRRMLGLIRGGAEAQGPQPGLAAVPSLAEAAGATLVVVGDLASVPDGQSVAAYRIVQEALATGHHVTLTRSAGTLAVEVVFGAEVDARLLSGLRRRAEMYDGTLEAAPTDDGWSVRAVLKV